MLNILCALHCEAKPLIQRLGLKQKREPSPFPVFENGTARLVVCGIGKIAAATATGWLAAANPARSAWLNIGVAGHADLPLGYAALAHSITDSSTSRRFYPDISLIKGMSSYGVTTIDKPSREYPGENLIEMEAAGFYQAAQRFATVDCIHCLKIISDNTQHPPEKIDKGFVQELIEESLPTAESLLEQMSSLIPCAPVVDSFPYLERCHWTETEKHRLERLLVRWNAMNEKPPACQHLETSREILELLEYTLNQLPLCFTPSISKRK